MKYVAGLAAIVAFLVMGQLSILAGELAYNLMGWRAFDPSLDGTWWSKGTGFVAAALVFWLIMRWRRNAAIKWRKTLAARARA